MNNYRDHEVEDFVCEDFFIEWVFKPQPANSEFWDNWKKENPDRVQRLERARNILLALKVVPNEKQLNDDDVLNIIEYVKEGATDFNQPEEITPKPYRFKPVFKWYAVAASLLIFCIAAISYLYLKTPAVQQISYQAPTDSLFVDDVTKIHNQGKEKALVELSDGSIAILSAGASLTYPKKFATAHRDVYLEGEAFFEVYKNPKQPFLVRTKHLITKVLGTSFTVSASANRAFKVVVHTGKVLVYDTDVKAKNTWVMLKPNQQTTFLTATSQFKTDTIARPLALSIESANKLFTFKETPLSVIVDRFERAYQVNIVYDEAKYGSTTVTGDLGNLMLNEKIQFICKAINASFEIDRGRIVIL